MSDSKPASRPNNVPVRLSDKGLEWVDKTKREYDVTRSDVIREALAVAAKHPDEMRSRLLVISVGF